MQRAPLVLIVRDPDASNQITVYDGDVIVHDVDLGHYDLRDVDEYRAWALYHLGAAEGFEQQGYGEAVDTIRALVEQHAPREVRDAEPGWSRILAWAST